MKQTATSGTIFLSTPSARRATSYVQLEKTVEYISIHALREEGDSGVVQNAPKLLDFYPRPPRGGRLQGLGMLTSIATFLSTPSARRAT